METHAHRFAGVPDSVSEARHWVAQVLNRPNDVPPPPDSVVATAELLVSELATNAIMHTASGAGGKYAILVHVWRRRGLVRVTVSDDGGTGHRPHLRRAGTNIDAGPDGSNDADTTTNVDTDGGRGLTLVDAFAQSWGPLVTETGASGVYFTLVWPTDLGAVTTPRTVDF